MKPLSPALILERSWPWLASLCALAIWWWVGRPFPRATDGLFGSAATLASIFASFLGVAMAIILGFKGTESFRVIEKLGFASILFGFLKAGIFSSVVFACLSLLGFFIYEPHANMAFA